LPDPVRPVAANGSARQKAAFFSYFRVFALTGRVMPCSNHPSGKQPSRACRVQVGAATVDIAQPEHTRGPALIV